MSNLGSVGSKDFAPESKSVVNEPTSQAPVDSQTATLSQIHSLFQSPSEENQTNAMKLVLAMMSKGHDVSEFSAYVVQQVASHDPLARQLAYVFLNHYAKEAPETAVLSVNTFQRSLTDSDPMVRALALKVMSSIRAPEILPTIRDAVTQVAGDPSPYVKKAAAFAIIKASELDPSEIESYLPIIDRLLHETSPISFSGAIAAYWTLCPDNIDLLHPHFRSICQNITKLDDWAQLFVLRSLTVYARYCFKSPAADANQENETAFWDESAQKDAVSSDHLLLIRAAKQMLSSPNSAVVMAAASLLYYTAPPSTLSCVARPLVRLLYESQIASQFALTAILTIASTHSHIFVPHLNHFFIRQEDIPGVRKLKLKVLSLLASQANAETILNELSIYTGSTDQEFAASAVKTMGQTAISNEAIIPYCLVSLLRLMSRAEGPVLSEVVLVIAHILRKRRGTDDEAHALRQLCKKFLEIKDASARAAVLSIVGDMHETHPEFAPQLLRYVAKNFKDEPGEVRLQALTLAAKLWACGENHEVPEYVLKLGERDNDFDVRDRARFLAALNETKSEEIKGKLKTLLFPERKAPQWSSLEGGKNLFQIGSFSHFFNRSVRGYEELPDWAPDSERPDDSVRLPVAAPGHEGMNEAAAGKEEEKGPVELSDFFGEGEEKKEEEGFFSEDAAEYYDEEEEKEEEKKPIEEKKPAEPKKDEEEDVDAFFK